MSRAICDIIKNICMMNRDKNDVFDSVVLADNLAVLQGYQDGVCDGRESASSSCVPLGVRHGASLASEMGFYHAFVSVLQQQQQPEHTINPDVTTTTTSNPPQTRGINPVTGLSASARGCSTKRPEQPHQKQLTRHGCRLKSADSLLSSLAADLQPFADISSDSSLKQIKQQATVDRVRVQFRRLHSILKISESWMCPHVSSRSSTSSPSSQLSF